MRFALRTIGFFAQAFKGRVAPFARSAAVATVLASLAGCSLTGKGLDEASVGAIAVVDDTARLSADPFAKSDDAEGAERDRLLDEDTIRNAVTSAHLAGSANDTVEWANQYSPSDGASK